MKLGLPSTLRRMRGIILLLILLVGSGLSTPGLAQSDPDPEADGQKILMPLIVGGQPQDTLVSVAASSDIVISQVYGGGGNSGATYTHDFIELFNRGTAPVSLAGWSVQYASGTGTGSFGASSTQLTELPSISLAPGQYLLIQEGAGSGNGIALPTPDVTDATPIAMSGSSGKVALVNSTNSLGCNGGSTACTPTQLAQIIDLVGYGSANFAEGSAAPGLSNTTAAIRNNAGCAETDSNSDDFTAATPTPRNSASPVNLCASPIATVINEVLASTTGTDVEYIELYGAPGAALAGLSLIYIESNDAAGAGTIDFRFDFGASDTLGLNGFYLIGTASSLLSTYSVTPNANIGNNSLENSSATVALVETSSLVGGSVSGSEVVLDVVGITDADPSSFFFNPPVIGPDGNFFPAGVRRLADGVDTDTVDDWTISDFNLGTDNTPTAGTTADVAPSVSETSPTDSATNVPASSDISITFSESVDVADGAIRVECPSGNLVASNVAANDVTIVTIDPASDLPATTTCAIIIDANGVTDNDGTPDTLAGPANFAFTTGSGSAITLISAIQGSGATATSGTFTIEGIVVGDYQTQGSGQLRGFFVQEEDSDADADAATSEGIFVFCSSCPTAVSVGDKVRVTGASSDFFDMSQLTATSADSVEVITTGNPLPTPASVQLPIPGVPSGDLAAATAVINSYLEPFEGMLVTFPTTLAVSEYFELARYGQLILSADGRPHTFTAVNTPTEAGLIDHEIDLASRTIILDDTDNRQNRPVDTPNTAYYYPVPGLDTGNFFRGGDTIANLTGVLHWSFAGQSGTDAWRIRPVTEAYSYAFTTANPRPAAPTVAGSLKVASFNVLNYFLTVDTTASNNVGDCSPSFTLDCRGADSVQELDRQRAKLTQALLVLDADIVGLIELENTPGVTPPQQIVDDLNAILGSGIYSFIDTGPIGTDAIRVALIYKPGKVTPVGNFAILDSSVDPNFIDTRNRPALAQTFQENSNSERVTVVVNHLKSKGSGCGVGDDDTTTGQGNCNGTRTLAAQALATWLAGDPTSSGDPDVLIIGDLNAYAKEDPIVALQNAGYTDMVAAFGGPDAYSYVFDGQLGYLDHALANSSLTPQVAGVTEWHINADEIPLFDYNDNVLDTGESSFEEESDVLSLYAADPYRTSDHDPVVIGLNLSSETTITIVKDSRPDNRRNFRFTGDLGRFRLDDAHDHDRYGSSITFDVNAGTYTVIEEVPHKWYLTNIVCEGGNSSVDLEHQRVAITVNQGQNATCTFINEYSSSIRVEKYLDSNGNGHRFWEVSLPGWEMKLYDSEGTLVAVDTTNRHGKVLFRNIAPGQYTLCETQRSGWFNSTPGTTDPTYNQPCYALNIGPAEEWFVEFGNHRNPHHAAVTFATPVATNITSLTMDDLDDDAYEVNGSAVDSSVDPYLDQPAQGEPSPIFLPSITR